VAVLAAMKDARFPKVSKEGIIDYRERTKEKVPMEKLPIAVTVYKMGKDLFVDPTDEEEKLYDSRLTITTTEDETICSLQKGGEGTLTTDDISTMVDMATKHAKALRKAL
ncbi:MAG TPA: RNA-binding protein, partial [Candidatus Nanoarchaeia archaeon]|nr:RNA-binding protein [Candidatus Nanoarchaeia archaeon]